MSSQSQKLKLVHLKHSLLTLRYHSKYVSPLFTIYTVSLFHIHFFYFFFFCLPCFIDSLRTQFLSLWKPPSLLLSSVLPCISVFDLFLSLLLSSKENTIDPQVVWASLDEECKETEGKSLTFFFYVIWKQSKEPIFFLPTGLQDESYLHHLPPVSSL